MSLRVLHVLDHSIPLHSGYSFRTLALLREQHKLGWQTWHLTTPKQGPGQALQEGVGELSFYRTPSAANTGLLTQMRQTAGRLGDLVRELKPDLIHAHSPVLNALPSLWVGRCQRVPVVYEMRASWEDAAVDHGSTREGSLRYRLSRGLESFALARADAITTICEGLRGDIAVRGIDAQKITVIPNAVDASLFQFGVAADPELRRRLGLDGFTVLGFAGSFYAYEGLSLLLEAMAQMRTRNAKLKLLLVGGGPQEEALRAQCAALGLQDAVVFTGRVPHAEVQRYYELIDLLAYPRMPIRLTELVTPLKPLEAMAQGRVLVASDVGGHRELIRAGETGYLFKAGDVRALSACIEQALAQQQDWPRMREQARRYVEQERTWTHSVARYREAYGRALAQRGRQHPALA